jgi:hypothetical protein
MPPPRATFDSGNENNQKAFASNSLQTAKTLREYQQLKYEKEREAKRRKISRWDNASTSSHAKEKETPHKKSVEAVSSPQSAINISISPSNCSSAVSQQPSTIRPPQILRKYEPISVQTHQVYKDLQRTKANDQQPEKSNDQPGTSKNLQPTTSKSHIPEKPRDQPTTSKNLQPTTSKNLQPGTSKNQMQEKPKDQIPEKTKDKSGTSKNQMSAESPEEDVKPVMIKMEIKEEVESDAETLPEDFNDRASCYDSDENIDTRLKDLDVEFRPDNDDLNENVLEEASCEEFIPLNIKEEPIEIPANFKKSSPQTLEDVEVKIKQEVNSDDLTEPEDENVCAGESDAGSAASDTGNDANDAYSDASDESKESSVLGMIDTTLEDPDLIADIGNERPNAKKKVSGKLFNLKQINSYLFFIY